MQNRIIKKINIYNLKTNAKKWKYKKQKFEEVFWKNEKYYKVFLYQNILNVINSVILFKRILFFIKTE